MSESLPRVRKPVVARQVASPVAKPLFALGAFCCFAAASCAQSSCPAPALAPGLPASPAPPPPSTPTVETGVAEKGAALSPALLLAKEAIRNPKSGRFACEWDGTNRDPGATYHVNPTGKDTSDGTSLQQAFATLQRAADAVQAGDTVLVHGGKYTGKEGDAAVLRIHTSGTEAAPITFQAAPGEHPVIESNAWSAIQVADASYILIEGFELVGPNAEITREFALEHKTDKTNPQTNSQGIEMWNYKTGGRSHHVIARNNRIHDFGGSAISGSECDCITIADNVMYRSGFYSVWGGGGVIIWQPRTLVQAPGYKLVIRGNRVFDIWNYVPYIDAAPITEQLTGAAIVLDLFTKHGFAGPSLVEGNVAYRNQACGIQNYETINVDVVSNTLFQNQLAAGVEWGEFCDFRSHGTRVINNVFVASKGHGATFLRATIPDAVFSHNLYWPEGAAAATMGTEDRYGDPRFVSLVSPAAPVKNARVAEVGWDFHLGEGSAALDNADPQATPLQDADGKKRPLGQGPDRGAYER